MWIRGECISVSSRWGWGPSASEEAPAAMPSRGHVNPRRVHQRQFALGVGPQRQCRKDVTEAERGASYSAEPPSPSLAPEA